MRLSDCPERSSKRGHRRLRFTPATSSMWPGGAGRNTVLAMAYDPTVFFTVVDKPVERVDLGAVRRFVIVQRSGSGSGRRLRAVAAGPAHRRIGAYRALAAVERLRALRVTACHVEMRRPTR